MHTANPAPADVHVSIYQAMSFAAAEQSLPRGAHGALARGIDRLRADHAAAGKIGKAEAAYVAIHRLEWALLNRDDEAENRARNALSMMADAWLSEAPVAAFA